MGHFEKYGFGYLKALYGIEGGGKKSKTGFYADTGLMSYCLNEQKGGHGLKDWAYKLGMGNYELELDQWKLNHPECNPDRGGNLNLTPARILYPYNIDDCIADYRLYFKLKKRLKKQNLWDRPFMFPLMWLFWLASTMELEGMNLDLEQNKRLHESFRERIAKEDEKLNEFPEIKMMRKKREQELLSELYERVTSYKRPVENVKSKVFELYQNALAKLEKNGEDILEITPDTKREIVYDILKYPATVVTGKKQQPSVQKWVLEGLQEENPSRVLKHIIHRGELESSVSKYIKPVVEWASTDGRTHTTFKPQGTATGRFASEDPNHQNFPKRYELAKELRTQFVSRNEDYILLEADEKQIELRLMADRAKDKTLIQEFNDGKDPHRMAASAAYNIPEERVTKEQRQDAKAAVSFGLIYGREAYALAGDFGWSERRAKKFKDRYFGKYDGVWRYLQERREYILEHGEVVSHFGRHRRLHNEILSDREGTVNEAVRQGINAPIQGDAADCTNIAACRMQRYLLRKRMKSRVIATVYDAVYIDTYKPEVSRIIPKLYQYMTDREFIKKMTGWLCAVAWDIDISLGPNLGKMVELARGKKLNNFIIPKGLLVV